MSTHPQVLGKYELRERLGEGGMAEVWKAFDTQLHRYVAIKLMHADLQNDPEFMGRFVREARAIASLRHPNIVQIYDFQTFNASESSRPIVYMVMEYIEGQTLAGYLNNTSRVGKIPSAGEIVQLFASISRAIDYAHERGMLHRDIKPANILLDGRNTSRNPMGEPILSDFGIAKLMGVSGGTVRGTWMGTPQYISPEQAQGNPGDERSDLYALGVILYEICTGVQPFRGETVTAIMIQHITAVPTSPSLVNPNIPPALSEVILRSLAKDPAARFSSASALTAAMAQALNMPIPADITLPGTLGNDAPTYLSSPQSEAQSSLPSTLPAQLGENFAPPLMNTPPYRQSFPETAVSSTEGASALVHPNAAAGPASPVRPPDRVAGASPATTRQPPSSPSAGPERRRRKGLLIGVIALVVLVVLGSGLGGFFLLSHNAATTSTVGQVFFVSSGQVDVHSSHGINDELQINLHNLSQPAAGKAFYAWLKSDKNVTESNSILVGTLAVNNGNVNFQYTGDGNHTNLLEFYSQFLITEESANPTPMAPSPDQNTWRYSATLPQTVNPVDHYSLLDHLRHLLAKDPDLEPLHLHGGLDIWLYRNTQSVMERAGIAANDCTQRHDTGCVYSNIIRILDYLDGKVYVQKDVPPGTANLIDPTIGSVALLEFDQQNQNPPGYLYHINKHLQGIIQAPGATMDQSKLAGQISTALNQVTVWLQQVRSDAKQLVNMPTNQLLSQQSLSILNDMKTQADFAYSGQVDPATNNVVKDGVSQIRHNIEHLAAFTVTAYTQK